MYQQSEAEIRANKPVLLFEVNGKKYSTPILPINKADEWLESIDPIAELEANVNKARGNREENRKARKAFNTAVYDAVFRYNPEAIPRDAIESAVTPAQMIEAFRTLQYLTDPFDQAQVRAMEEVLAKMKNLPEAVVGKVLTAIR